MGDRDFSTPVEAECTVAGGVGGHRTGACSGVLGGSHPAGFDIASRTRQRIVTSLQDDYLATRPRSNLTTRLPDDTVLSLLIVKATTVLHARSRQGLRSALEYRSDTPVHLSYPVYVYNAVYAPLCQELLQAPLGSFVRFVPVGS